MTLQYISMAVRRINLQLQLPYHSVEHQCFLVCETQVLLNHTCPSFWTGRNIIMKHSVIVYEMPSIVSGSLLAIRSPVL